MNAPCSLLPEAMPDTSENAAPEPNADIILRMQRDDGSSRCMHKQALKAARCM